MTVVSFPLSRGILAGARTVVVATTNRTQAPRMYAQSKAPPRAEVYQVEHRVQALTRLPDEGLRLVRSVPTHVQWEPATGAFAAYEDALGLWFGLGETADAALLDLGAVLGEVFRELEGAAMHLAPPLQRQLAQLRKVVAYADARP